MLDLSAPSGWGPALHNLDFDFRFSRKKNIQNRVRVHVSSGKEKVSTTSTMVTDFAFREDFRSLRSQLELAASLDEKLKYVKPETNSTTPTLTTVYNLVFRIWIISTEPTLT